MSEKEMEKRIRSLDIKVDYLMKRDEIHRIQANHEGLCSGEAMEKVEKEAAHGSPGFFVVGAGSNPARESGKGYRRSLLQPDPLPCNKPGLYKCTKLILRFEIFLLRLRVIIIPLIANMVRIV